MDSNESLEFSLAAFASGLLVLERGGNKFVDNSTVLKAIGRVAYFGRPVDLWSRMGRAGGCCGSYEPAAGLPSWPWAA